MSRGRRGAKMRNRRYLASIKGWDSKVWQELLRELHLADVSRTYDWIGLMLEA